MINNRMEVDTEPIEFKQLYEIIDQDDISMYERSLILNFYKLILTLKNQSCNLQTYKSADKTIALKDIILHFYNKSVEDLKELYMKHVYPTQFCEIVNNSMTSLNHNLEVFSEHFLLKIYYKLYKIESKNDWISPRFNSDWDIKFDFKKLYRD